MLGRSWVSGALVLAVTLLGAPLSAQSSEVGDRQYQDAMTAAGNKLANAMRWPQSGDGVGFKTLVVGEDFDLESPLVDVWVRDIDVRKPAEVPFKPRPFDCSTTPLSRILECTLSVASGHEYPDWVLQLQTAFGDDVALTFRVLLNAPIDGEVVKANRLGKARIMLVTVTRDHASPQYLDHVKDTITSKAGRSPTVRTSQKPLTIKGVREETSVFTWASPKMLGEHIVYTFVMGPATTVKSTLSIAAPDVSSALTPYYNAQAQIAADYVKRMGAAKRTDF